MNYGPPPFQCRACGYAGHAKVISKITTGGWVLFVAMVLFLCWPLCWLPLVFLRDRRCECPGCHVMT